MATAPQSSAVDRAADLFTSIGAEAEGGEIAMAQVARIGAERQMSAEQILDALAFLEANNVLEVRTVVTLRSARQ